MSERRKRQPVREPQTMRIPDRKYQPSRAELREEIDMPKLSLKRAREAFMRPFQFIRNDPDWPSQL